VTVHAALAEELPGLQNRNDGFLALLGKDRELDPAFLNVKHRIRGVALLEHMLVLLEFENRLPGSDFRKERLRIELIIVWRRQLLVPCGSDAGYGFSGSIFRRRLFRKEITT
jgi:hypothetical protein